MKLLRLLMIMAVLIGMPVLAQADVIVTDTDTTTTTGATLYGPDTPIGTFFHLVGDVVEFPFNAIGNLF
jgi:hypothetical protein